MAKKKISNEIPASEDWKSLAFRLVQLMEKSSEPEGRLALPLSSPKRRKKNGSNAIEQDAESQSKSKSGRTQSGQLRAPEYFRELVIDHPEWDRHKALEEAKRAGFAIPIGTMNVTYYETRKTVDLLRSKGLLGD